MKALMKQTIVEALAANDTDVERGSMLFEQLKHLNFVSWTNLMRRCMTSLVSLLNRIQAIHDIMAHVLATETSRQDEVSFILNVPAGEKNHCLNDAVGCGNRR